MYSPIHENLARVQAAERLAEATAYHRGRRLASEQRTSRRAERAAQRARLAVARAL